MIINKENWDIFCSGFMIRDCTYGFDNGRFAFYLVEEPDEHHLDNGWTTRVFVVNMEQPMETRFFAFETEEMSFSTISSAWTPNQTEYLLVDSFREVVSYKPNKYEDHEEEIPFDGRGYGFKDAGEIGSSIYKVVRVNNTVFAVGSPLRVFQRMADQQWMEHKGIPIPEQLRSEDREQILEGLDNSMLIDLAGFSEMDMYAVGGGGAVWHFDGETWRVVEFPTNNRLYTVTCGGDGLVYITDIRGSLYKGRGSSWELVVRMDQSLPFADSAWFDGRFWCANDYGMYILEGNRLVEAHRARIDPIPKQIALYSHRIDVSPDGTKMLVCGGNGAALCCEKKWEILFSDMDFFE